MSRVSPERFQLRDRALAERLLEKLKALGVRLRVMHVCGTHQDTLVRHGLEPLLAEANVEIRQGPGCPVCVTTPREIEEILLLAQAGKRVAAFGDMMRVPGPSGSLLQMQARGADVRVVYGVEDAVRLALGDGRETVFMAVGFETTAPGTALALRAKPPENFSVLTCHRTVPPALKALIEMGEVRLDGLIEPGHVSTIIGTRPYEPLSRKYRIPQVVAGFEPLDLLMAVYMLARQKKEGRAEVENEYSRVVRPEGNVRALELLESTFEPCDVAWRGFPVIPGSGLKLRAGLERWDARKRFADELAPLKDREFPEPKGCLCGEVLRGIREPQRCPLFGRRCRPDSPVGPCMVSAEGSCNILYKYGKWGAEGRAQGGAGG
ncbi:MAG: hydrogenase formation protein HypD [Thermoplasmatota archaeon]